MPYLLDFGYLLLLLAALPWLAWQRWVRGKSRPGLWRRLFGVTPVRSTGRRCVWFHAVSVGEVLLLRPVVRRFRELYPTWDCVISASTVTGLSVARQTYSDLPVIPCPLDFSWSVGRAMRRIAPDGLVLAELELWPNLIRFARRRGAFVAVINGRLSPRSYRRYRRVRWFVRWCLNQIDCLAVQNDTYAERWIDLGGDSSRIHVTGSVKYDGVSLDRNRAKSRELAAIFGLTRPNTVQDPLVWVVGSTQAPEEEIALRIYRRIRAEFPHLRLILVPRHPERFDEVATLLQRSELPFVRRSRLATDAASASVPPVILVDTIGELAAVWALADVAFVGGSLTPRGGQNMIEPAACGAAVVFGPNVWNFQDTVDRLLERNAAIQVRDADELERETRRLLRDPAARTALGQAARRFVQSQQGATERTVALLADLIRRRYAIQPASRSEPDRRAG